MKMGPIWFHDRSCSIVARTVCMYDYNRSLYLKPLDSIKFKSLRKAYESSKCHISLRKGAISYSKENRYYNQNQKYEKTPIFHRYFLFDSLVDITTLGKQLPWNSVIARSKTLTHKTTLFATNHYTTPRAR